MASLTTQRAAPDLHGWGRFCIPGGGSGGFIHTRPSFPVTAKGRSTYRTSDHLRAYFPPIVAHCPGPSIHMRQPSAAIFAAHSSSVSEPSGSKMNVRYCQPAMRRRVGRPADSATAVGHHSQMHDEGGTRWRLGQRPALDGLRGIAIILVLAAHAHVPFMGSGGIVGVGLFFTLSGFLITGLLIEERERTGRTSFRGFYARRARRLLPAFLTLLLAVVAARVVLGPWVLDWSVLPAVLLYVGNWVPISGGDLGALGATWTLSVEEQFYIMWPLVVAALATRRRVIAAGALLAVVSLLVRYQLLTDGEFGLRIPLGSDTVAFALLAGAVSVGLRLSGSPGRSRPWLAVVGLAALAGLMFIGPIWFLILGLPSVAIASVATLWAATGSGPVRFLETPWLRWFGSRSYGIYLWHAPILWAMAEHYALPVWVLVGFGVPASLLLAEASYRWVESPFRARQRHPHPGRSQSGGAEPRTVKSGRGVVSG